MLILILLRHYNYCRIIMIMTQNNLLTADRMRQALQRLSELLDRPVTLILGGGGAMILAHHFPLSTLDLDAVPKGIELHELDQWVKQVAREQNLASDWLNPYFGIFVHTLPQDYAQRLIQVFAQGNLTVQALGKEEMLIMKCFAHRQKDVGHARALIRKGANAEFVEKQIQSLLKKKIPQAQEALDFLYDVLDQEGEMEK